MTKNTMIYSFDRGITPALSSASRTIIATSLLLGTSMLALPAGAQMPPQPVPAPVAPQIVQTVQDIAQPAQPLMIQPTPPVARTADPLSNALSEWRILQDSENYSFASYASFLIAHKGWPNEAGMRKNAEKMLRRDGESASQVAAFFARFAPTTATGHLRFAEALEATGKRDEAIKSARLAWITGALVPEDEARLMSRYPAALQSGDHDARMDRLLWSRSTQNAARQIFNVSSVKRNLFSARLAFLTKAADAQQRASLVPAEQQRDAGFVADRNYWLRLGGQTAVARSALTRPLSLTAPPVDAATWLTMLELNAKAASSEADHMSAILIAKQIEGTYAPGTLIRDRSFAERDSYTNIAWLGGMAALEKVNRPTDAMRFFELYSQAAKSPQTRAKGLYWAGRAADQAGRKDLATLHYTAAAEFFDQFHGQLANERLGRIVALPANANVVVEVSSTERTAFERSEPVRAAVLLGQQGNWQEQTRFVRGIAANVEGEAAHVLAAELARKMNRPDMSLLVGKSAREDGFGGYFTPSFPVMKVPDEHRSSWTMIHAITRQESQFDREAMSRVGARGLMQLMPATARETAPSAGVYYSLSGLTQNPQDNIRLGSTYFGQLMSQFGGSYVLSVAAYNAGPGNVRKWLRNNGDPRIPGSDVIAWVEKIPLSETRGYVQRVLENAVVYDLLNPQRNGRPGIRISALLGGYSGRSSAGSR